MPILLLKYLQAMQLNSWFTICLCVVILNAFENFREARFLFNYFGFKINAKMNFSVLSHGSSMQMYAKIDRRTVYPTTPSSNITLNNNEF